VGVNLKEVLGMGENEEYLIIPGKWEIPYRHSAGKFATRFFNELKNGKIMGVKCSKCGRVLIPPRSFCERCFTPIEEWVEVKDTGVIETFTICYEKFTGLPDPPYTVAVIKLDGADTGMMHFIGGVDLSDPKKAIEKIKVGARVKAKWRAERTGSILDIEYFEIAE